jgi:hypothetical protein
MNREFGERSTSTRVVVARVAVLRHPARVVFLRRGRLRPLIVARSIVVRWKMPRLLVRPSQDDSKYGERDNDRANNVNCFDWHKGLPLVASS